MQQVSIGSPSELRDGSQWVSLGGKDPLHYYLTTVHQMFEEFELTIDEELNDKNEAFRWLGRAYEERTMRLEQITEPTFDGLRSDPRLIHLKALIGLPPS